VTTTAPCVELLWWEGCPSWPRALEELRAVAAEAGLDPDRIVVREIDDDAHAEAEGFVGSPTIRVDGHDIQPPDVGEAPGLTCRVYHLRDGRVSPTPDPADLRDALMNATSERK
jgi:hypothetical protein